MILSPEEQTEYREEIDYAIETHGYEYVWGKETAMDKTKGLLRDAPGKIMDGINKIVTNPSIISINEKLAAHNAKLNAESQGQRQGNNNQMLERMASESGFGGMQQAPMRNPQPRQQQPRRAKHKKPRQQPEPDQQHQDGMFDNNPLGNNPLGNHPFQQKGSGKRNTSQGSGLHFGGDHL